MKTMKMMMTLLAVAGLVLALGATAQAQLLSVTPPEGGYPQWYRLIFVTSVPETKGHDMGYYNTFVHSVANDLDGNEGSLVAHLGATWKLVGSTQPISAKQNTTTFISTDPGYVTAYDVPIYLLDGTLVAIDNDALWDASVDAPVNITEKGITYSGTVHTGTHRTGNSGNWPTDPPTDRYLGNIWLWNFTGSTQQSDYRWIEAGAYSGQSGAYPLYALSDPIYNPPAGTLFILR